MAESGRCSVGILVFPGVQQLDVTGPYEVFAMDSRCQVDLVGRSLQPLQSATGFVITPSKLIAECEHLDVLVVPGGKGVNALLEDEEILSFVREQAHHVRYLTSVCTGALVLGAAGLLKGKRASTHWMSLDLLSRFGAVPTDERVVWDGNIVTAGGVTSGIDFGLEVLAKLFDQPSAEVVQLFLQYAPAPPFAAGHPETAPAEIITRARGLGQSSRMERERIIEKITRSIT